MLATSVEEQRKNIRPVSLSDGVTGDPDMWLFEHYGKERLRSIGVVE
jgi:hypothetical protein